MSEFTEFLPAIGQGLGALGQAFGGNYYESEALRLQKRELRRNNRNNLWNRRFAQKQFDEAKHLARNQVNMRVADAKASGIHPLAALGMSPHSAGQFVAPSTPGSVSQVQGRNTSSALSALGQAVSAIPTPSQKASEANTLRNQELQNLYLEEQIRQARATTAGILSNAFNRVGGTGIPDDDIREPKKTIKEPHYTDGGSSVNPTVGPDISEVIMGLILDFGGGLKDLGKATAAHQKRHPTIRRTHRPQRQGQPSIRW